MVVRVFESPEQVSTACAMLFASQVTRKPHAVLGLATGSSPIGTYQQLINWYNEGILDFSQAVSFNLDEYVGIPESNECSYHCFMQNQLFYGINLKASYVPDGNAKDMHAACRNYDKAIKNAGGIDLQLLGIGHNGHIGFNEPADHFPLGTQVVTLTPSTIEANRRFFEKDEDVPRQAISMGVGTIMASRCVVLIAMGEDKQDAIYGAVKGPVTPHLPASMLQMHQNCIVLCDRKAAARL